MILSQRSIAPALRGNAVVVKPQGDAGDRRFLLAKIYEEAGLPPGVLNVVIVRSSRLETRSRCIHPEPDLLYRLHARGPAIGQLARNRPKDQARHSGTCATLLA